MTDTRKVRLYDTGGAYTYAAYFGASTDGLATVKSADLDPLTAYLKAKFGL